MTDIEPIPGWCSVALTRHSVSLAWRAVTAAAAVITPAAENASNAAENVLEEVQLPIDDVADGPLGTVVLLLLLTALHLAGRIGPRGDQGSQEQEKESGGQRPPPHLVGGGLESGEQGFKLH
jgi:hypothetical protein